MALYLFTDSYPYGEIEVFLEDEISILSKEFKIIEIYPLCANVNEAKRDVPPNVIVNNPIIDKDHSFKKIRSLLGFKALKYLYKDLFKYKVFFCKARLKSWLVAYSQLNILLNSEAILELFANINKDDICYFYWGKGSNLLAVPFKGRCKFVSRFHGEWDLWEENSGGYAPLRRELSRSLDKAIFIAKNGEQYFKEKYPDASTEVCPLGSKDYGTPQEDNSNNGLRIVSCSTVYGLKRVNLIYQMLNSFKDRKITWTHMGGGVDWDKLDSLVRKTKRPHLEVHLLGMMTHNQVVETYKANKYDIFINLSTNEGVPVSIMEAASFNIPVIATNVGSTAEIVTPSVGVLVSSNPSVSEVHQAIIQVMNGTFTPREFWAHHYSAETNYNRLAELFKSI